MKNRLTLIGVFYLLSLQTSLFADEGMWIPLLLEKNINRMHELGFTLSAEDIYSVNKSSLKDAIVMFGGGCTGEVVSPQGLLLTNHHCGYGVIQRHSSLEHDYLTDGFWAATMEDELPNPGLTVTFLVSMKEVTAQVLEGVMDDMNEAQRKALILTNAKKIEKETVGDTRYEADVVPYFHGNQYYLIITVVFKDIRLVGAPPSGIGKFGGDTDNWMWPRHTGDFSVFRIYADTNNQPAEYAKTNVPYKPRYYLPISLEGYDKGDFTLLFGNPGSTAEYLPACAVDMIAFKENPVKVGLRQKRLNIIENATENDRLVRIQYASKHARISNYWKKMIGETNGIRRTHAVDAKRKYEMDFTEWTSLGDAKSKGYDAILPLFDTLYTEMLPVNMAQIYLTEAGMAPEIFRFSLSARKLIKEAASKKTTPEDLAKTVQSFLQGARSFYKDYQPSVDQAITAIMLDEMKQNMEKAYLPRIFSTIDKQFKGNVNAYVTQLFSQSLFTDSVRLYRYLHNPKPASIRKLSNDMAYQLSSSIYDRYFSDVLPAIQRIDGEIDSLQRIFMKARMEMSPDIQFYPDANSTMRVSFGQVDGFVPADAVTYHHYTTTQGILEKEDSTIYDYAVDERLRELITTNNYGRYADADGTMHVAFVSTIHSTGGNSGAPVLNRKGELIGINFDRNWEGTMSDLMYDPDQCRNIVLDIRYLLFIMDTYAGATRLVEEMEIR